MSGKCEAGTKPDVGVRPWQALLGCIAGGTVLGAGYGGLVAGVHRVVCGRWDGGPAFAAGSVVTGTAIGLGIGAGLALAAWASNRWPRTFAPLLLCCAVLGGVAGLFGSRLVASAYWPLVLLLAGLTCLMARLSLVTGSTQPPETEGKRDAQAGRRPPGRLGRENRSLGSRATPNTLWRGRRLGI